MPTYTNPKGDRRSLTQTGSEVGDSQVTLNTNATGREDDIISWECPRKYAAITYAAGRHKTNFTPRTREDYSGDGAQTTFALTADFFPVHGEDDPADANYPPVVVANVTQDMEYAQEDLVYDYDANEVTLPSAPASGDTVAFYPILTEGELKYMGYDQFDHPIAALDQWGVPLHRFHDFDQAKRQTEVHLVGAATWEESEKLVARLDSPREIVWEDADYPRGKYASSIEQFVDIDV